MIRSILIEFHGWRGFTAARDLSGCAVTLGVITVVWSPMLWSQRLQDLRDRLEQLRRRP